MTAPNRPSLRVAQHGDARHFPARRAERIGGFALQVRHAAQNFPRDRSDDRQNHDRDDDSAGQHAHAVDRPGEKRRPSEDALQATETDVPAATES